jgi:hypothetical protein
MRRRGEVAEPPSPAPTATVAAIPPPSAAEVLARAHAGFVADVAAGRLATTAPERQDRLRSAVSQLLGALAHAGSSGGDVQVIDVDTPAKPKVGPRPPAVVHLAAASGLSRRLAFDVNGERNAYHTLERVRTRVLQGEADAGVVLREDRLRIGDGARRTLDVARSLEPLGGVAYLEDEAAAALIAADLLLDAVAGHELASGGRVIERAEALAHLVAAEPLVAALQPVLARAMAADPARGRRRGTTTSRRS